MALQDIIRDRKNKVELLRKEGICSYPSNTSVSHSLHEALFNFDKLLNDKTQITIAGRVTSLRDQGNVIFVDIKEEINKIQVVSTKQNTQNFQLLKKIIDIGDYFEFTGILFITKKGEKSLEVATARILTKSLRPLPSEWYGLSDIEERYRKRYLDIILNNETRANIETRFKIIKDIRLFLYERGFTEVDTPILQPIPGGALAKPFKTHHEALNYEFYLRIAPELYLKRLLVAGFTKIFEIGKVFRNEGMDRDHNPEFSMMELYIAYENYRGLMKFTEEMLKPYFKDKFKEITYTDAFNKYSDKKLATLDTEEIDDVFKHVIRPNIKEPTFIIHYPKSISPLSKSLDIDSNLTERFQLIIKNTKLVNGF